MVPPMRRLLPLALVLAGCHQSPTFTLTLLGSPIVDEQPLAGVDTLELRWSRPGQARVVEHVVWQQQSPVRVTPPAIADGTELEVAAVSAGNVVAVGRTAPLAAKATAASVYLGLVDRFVATPSPRPVASARFGASATLVGGKVWIVGGATRGSPGAPDPASITNAFEVYDPVAGTFTPSPVPNLAERIYHAAVATPGGDLRVVGGLGKLGPLDDVFEVETLRSVARLPSPRWAAAAATLPDGTLLLAGGYTTSDGMGGGTLAGDAILVAPDGSTATVALPSPRAFAVATTLADGNVLVSGGVDGSGARDDALVYTAATRSFAVPSPSSARAAMLTPRVGHSATLLASGAVFVFGGNDGRASVSLPELWSPAAGGFVDAPVFNIGPRQHVAATALADGSVLLAGGELSPQKSANPSPVYDPLLFQPAATGATGVLHDDLAAAPARAEATATLLPDGSVLYVGGGVGDPRTLAGGAQLFVPCFGACLAVTP